MLPSGSLQQRGNASEIDGTSFTRKLSSAKPKSRPSFTLDHAIQLERSFIRKRARKKCTQPGLSSFAYDSRRHPQCAAGLGGGGEGGAGQKYPHR